MENLFRSLKVKDLRCLACGKVYPISEFYEMAAEVGKPGVGYPQYGDLFVCLECWRVKHAKK